MAHDGKRLACACRRAKEQREAEKARKAALDKAKQQHSSKRNAGKFDEVRHC
jgi:hypothetical protein